MQWKLNLLMAIFDTPADGDCSKMQFTPQFSLCVKHMLLLICRCCSAYIKRSVSKSTYVSGLAVRSFQ